jgi:hypothetical protein
MPLIERIASDFGRLYWVPSQELLFPSVTTVLGIGKESEHVTKLREELGEEKFLEVTIRGQNRGTCMHLFLENFLIYKQKQNAPNNECLQWTLIHTDKELNEQGFTKKEIDLGRGLFWNFWYDEDFLSDIEEVMSTEEFLYSIEGRFGGTTDFFYRSINKFLKFTDFKSSTYEKHEEDIDKYKMQISAYIKAYAERTGHIADLGQILISNQSGDQLTKFYLSHSQVEYWYGKFQELVTEWFDINSENIVAQKKKLLPDAAYISYTKPLF